MKKIIVFLLWSALGVFSVSCSGKSGGDPTEGTITDGVYYNEYFGLEIPVPDGWRTLDNDEWLETARQSFMDSYGDEQVAEQMIAEMMEGQVVLLQLYPSNPPDAYEPGFNLTLVRGPFARLTPDGATYIRRAYSEDPMEPDITDQEIGSYTVGGLEFASYSLPYTYDEVTYHMYVYARRIGEYILVFHLNGEVDEMPMLWQMLQRVTFEG